LADSGEAPGSTATATERVRSQGERAPSPLPGRWGAGIVNHGAYDDLGRCLEALESQTDPPSAIVVYDTSESRERFEAVRLAYLGAAFERGANLGYAGGANRVVERLRSAAVPLDFVLLLNPDVVLEPDFGAVLVRAMEARPAAAIATGKLLRADGRTLDSAGIVFPRHRRPRDRGSEEPDRGQFDATEWVDAASGAAMMLRVALVDELALEGELFDESFFAYHEDTDLCWRARRFGHRVLYEPGAVACHLRGWQRDRRDQIPVAVRRHSFKNHYLQLVKNETGRDLVRNLPWLIGWELLRAGFVAVRDRPMWAAYRDAWRALPEAWRKRALIRARAHERLARGGARRVLDRGSS